jgi:hypothetical protein
VVKDKIVISNMRVLIEVVDTLGIKTRGAALNAVDLIAFLRRNSDK